MEELPITAGISRRRLWRPRLEEAKRAVRQIGGCGVRRGVEHVGLRARTPRETGNWLILTDCSNAFNSVNRTAVRLLQGWPTVVQALALFAAKR